MTLGTVLTLDEAADRLRLNKRTVAKVAKRNGLCSVAGREILFTETDIAAIWEVLRCPSSSPAAKAPTIGTCGARSEEKAYLSLVALATERQRKRSASRQKRAC